MADLDSDWQRKGATLSDKTARKDFGLTQDEIVRAIRVGKLHSAARVLQGGFQHNWEFATSGRAVIG